MNNIAVKDGRLRRTTLLVLALGVFVVMLIGLMLGRYTLSGADIYHAFWYRIYGMSFGEPVDSIVFNLRLPRVLLAALAGAALACSGAAFQSLFGNPLATPDTLGVTAGASVGAVLGILWNLPMIGMQLMSLVAGIGTIFLTIMIAKSKKGVGIVLLILSGVIVGALANAVISILKYVADPNEKLPQITYWLMGSLAGANLRSLAIGTPFILLGIITILVLRWRLNILALGDDEARAAGMNVRLVRGMVIVAATLTTASVVSMCGQVGWVGLLIPHCARMICGNNNRFVVPISLLLGAMFLVLIDTLARSVSEAEIPISVLTALVGAPFFIYLLRKTGGGWS